MYCNKRKRVCRLAMDLLWNIEEQWWGQKTWQLVNSSGYYSRRQLILFEMVGKTIYRIHTTVHAQAEDFNLFWPMMNSTVTIMRSRSYSLSIEEKGKCICCPMLHKTLGSQLRSVNWIPFEIIGKTIYALNSHDRACFKWDWKNKSRFILRFCLIRIKLNKLINLPFFLSEHKWHKSLVCDGISVIWVWTLTFHPNLMVWVSILSHYKLS